MRSRKTIIHSSSNYAINESYFLTICVVQKHCLLGKIKGGAMELTTLGIAVQGTLDSMNAKYYNALIPEYVVMPNHVHMIVDLARSRSTQVETATKTMTVSDVVRDFKSFTTNVFSKPLGKALVPLWQRGFYDHRIRNDEELADITRYIKENPEKWATDKFYVE